MTTSGTTTPMHTDRPEIPRPRIDDADLRLRADTYGLLANLLAQPPSPELLQRLAALADIPCQPPQAPLNLALRQLGLSARHAVDQPAEIVREYHRLFIGISEGEVVPYASWHRTGAMMGKPLVRLRADLQRLGFTRRGDLREPEDHAAMECEVMGMLLMRDAQDGGSSDAGAFFQQHLKPWLPAFFEAVKRAPSADFYASLADLGLHFMTLEQTFHQSDTAASERTRVHQANRFAGG